MSDQNSKHWAKTLHPVVAASRRVGRSVDQSRIKYITELFNIRHFDSVADFGCGLGRWLHAAKDAGARTVCGYDIPEVPLAQRNLKEDEFVEADFTKEVNLRQRYDLAISTEVAEHLPMDFAGHFVKLLTKASDWILFGAAIPYQGGMGHQNENWIEYWADHFTQNDYVCYDIFRSKFWTDTSIAYFYRQNTMLFVKSGCDSELRSRGYSPTEKPVSFIHPEMYIKAVNRSLPQPLKRIDADIESYYVHVLPKGYSLSQRTTYGNEKLNFSDLSKRTGN